MSPIAARFAPSASFVYLRSPILSGLLVLGAIGCGFCTLGCSETSPPAASTSAPRKLRVEISGLADLKGVCRLAIYCSAKGFNDPDQSLERTAIDVTTEALIWELPWPTDPNGLPFERLAIAAHHDRNDNGKLDKNALGIPTEPYGFSNNPRGMFGPPSFEQSAINQSSLDVSLLPDEESVVISIVLH